jgi:RHS repeat-associated protein
MNNLYTQNPYREKAVIERSRNDSSGLIYFGARYYDPNLGRYLQADTVLDGLNRYTFCGNNPIRYVDPNGHEGEAAKAISKGGGASVGIEGVKHGTFYYYSGPKGMDWNYIKPPLTRLDKSYKTEKGIKGAFIPENQGIAKENPNRGTPQTPGAFDFQELSNKMHRRCRVIANTVWNKIEETTEWVAYNQKAIKIILWGGIQIAGGALLDAAGTAGGGALTVSLR